MNSAVWKPSGPSFRREVTAAWVTAVALVMAPTAVCAADEQQPDEIYDFDDESNSICVLADMPESYTTLIELREDFTSEILQSVEMLK